MFDFVGVSVLAGLAVLFGWLAARAWQAKRAWVKWSGVIVSGLLTLVCGLTFALALVGFYKLNAPHANPVGEVNVAGTAAQIARGRKLAGMCAECHAAHGELPLSGQNFFEGGGPPMGTIYAPNLTPAGNINGWTDGEVIRAIREGVHKSGRSLIIMPAEIYRHLSDEDVQALVAYLRSQPAVGEASPPTQFNTVGAVMLNLFPSALTAQAPVGPVPAVPEGVTPEYGHYLVSIAACALCHGEDLGGLTESSGPPPGPNLTTVVPKWTEAEFVTFFRTGKLPSGSPISDKMPWKMVGDFASDNDLKAMYAYLHSLPPVEGSTK
jgi:cytochrome c553